MATNKDASAQDIPMAEDTPRCGPCGKAENLEKTECRGNEGDPIDAAGELLRIAEDPALSLHERFRQVDKAADRLLAAFPGPQTKPPEEESPEEIDDATYDATSDAVAKEYIESFIAQAKDIIEIGLDKIVEGLCVPTGHIPEEAIRQAQKHRELIVPRLIRILEAAVSAARDGEKIEGHGYLFGCFLLTEFKIEAAFPAIRELFVLSDNMPQPMFTRLVKAKGPGILATLLWNRPEALEETIADSSLSEHVRLAAAGAVAHLVEEGRIPWESGVRQIGRQLCRYVDEKNAARADRFLTCLEGLLPWDIITRIDEQCESDRADQGSHIMEFIEESIADPKVECPEPVDMPWSIGIEDTVKELRVWGFFPENRPSDEGAGDCVGEGREREAHSPSAPHFLQDREEPAPVHQPIVSETPRTGRNQLCPCGSGKKYKKCCGASR